jgi:hypothetical protein
MTLKPSIYPLKLTLSHTRPPIWRRVEVPADISLYRLAAVIITAMGWSGGHLHQFRIGEEYYGIPHEDDLSETIDERKVSLKSIVDQGIKKFIFEYDFGDGWEHVVEFEGTIEPSKGAKYPRCTAGARCCPPEDCGGPPGYEDFLQAIRDPKHPEHESMREWIGGDFDPEKFYLNALSDLADASESMEEEWNEHFE